MHKEHLLQLSEKIVDLGEVLEETDEQLEPQTIRKATQELRKIGDTLLDLETSTQGDDQAYVQFMLGSVCQLLRYHVNAVEAYHKALHHWPDHVGIINELFHSQIELGAYEDALATIKRSMATGGETPDILQNMAITLVHLDRIAEAKTVLFNCISKFPDDAESNRLLRELDTYHNA